MSENTDNQETNIDPDVKETAEKMLAEAEKYAVENKDSVPLQKEFDESKGKEMMEMLFSKMNDTRVKGNNIVTRMQNGIITPEEAKKRMRALMDSYATEMIGDLAKVSGIGVGDFTGKKDEFEKALKWVNEQLGQQ